MLTRRHTGFPKDWHRASFLETYSFRRARTPVLSLPVFFFFFSLPQQFSIECNIYLNIPVPSHSRLYHHVLEHLYSNDFRLHPDVLLLSYTEGESEQPTVQTDLFWEYLCGSFTIAVLEWFARCFFQEIYIYQQRNEWWRNMSVDNGQKPSECNLPWQINVKACEIAFITGPGALSAKWKKILKRESLYIFFTCVPSVDGQI